MNQTTRIIMLGIYSFKDNIPLFHGIPYCTWDYYSPKDDHYCTRPQAECYNEHPRVSNHPWYSMRTCGIRQLAYSDDITKV